MTPKMSWLMLAVAPLVLRAAVAQHTAAEKPQTVTLDARGQSPEWEQNPHMHEFYELSVETLGAGAERVDVADYERKSYAIFRAFARSVGADPDRIVEHVKDIPRQMVAIVKADPKTLDSYESFLVALRGPR